MFSPAAKTLAVLWLLAHIPFSQCQPDTIIRDVAIIGGGSSGTFSAVRLRDQGKSVILIEKEDILGGHTNTYQDPATGVTVDYGVEVFHNQQIVKDYFNRLNVPWAIQPALSNAGAPVYLDDKTAEPVNYTNPNPIPGLYAYTTHLAQYAQLELGFFLPDPVPGDLLLPFGQFVAKYPEIGSAVSTIFRFGQGLGDFLAQPTLYVFKNFGLDIIQDIATGFLVVTTGNNQEIYQHATALLGADVLLRSTVVATLQRDSNGIKLHVQTPSGPKIIQAKKLLIAIPQKIENLHPFALDDRETGLFCEFLNTGYYTSLVSNTGLPANFSSLSVGADTPFNIPTLPGVYMVSATAIEGVFDIKYGSPDSLPDYYVKQEIMAYVKKLQKNGFAEKVNGQPEFVRFNSHTPFELTVPPEQIANGFYKDLYALQGYRNTWYTGAAFHTQDSSMLWNFTDAYVLPDLLK